jgi:cytoskeletal protein RodZ
MDNLGQYLRSLRDEKGIAVETVSRDIKLTLEQIDAIETNQLSRLGDHGFARAIVYTYVRYLAADEKRSMYLFDLSWPPLQQTHFTPKKPIKEKKVLISTNFIWLISIIILAIILGSIIWISYTKGYLERPFDNLKKAPDSITTRIDVKPAIEKPDTLRSRMLKLAHTQTKPKEVVEKKKKLQNRKGKTVAKDSTDYIDGLIFETKESPFNSRF